MVEAGGVDPATFFNNPEGAQTVCELAEKNEDNQFTLAISELENISHDCIRLRLQFPNPEWIIGMPVANHIKLFS